MRTLIVNIMPPQEAISALKQDFAKALSGTGMGNTLTFPDIETLAYVLLNTNRLAIIHNMTGAGPMSIRELSRQLNRDFKAVHTDVQALLNADVLEKVGAKIVFRYDEIHFDFVIGKAAA